MSGSSGRRTSSRRVVVHLPERVALLDVAGPADVFATASVQSGRNLYDMTYVSRSGGSRPAWNGMHFQTQQADEIDGPIDTLLVPGGLEGPSPIVDAEEESQLRRLAAVSDRIASVCTGVFRVAATGLLDGHEATTHWAFRDQLAAAHPSVSVVHDRVHVSSGRYWSTAGASAGLDLGLALLEADHGAKLARDVAKWLVVYMRRPGSQPQISSHLVADGALNGFVLDALARIANHPGEDHSLGRLARLAGVSERHFSRVFRRETGSSPAEHVTSVRLEIARRLLETTTLRVSDVALRSGFGRAETLDRAYRRHLGTSPSQLRRERALAARTIRQPATSRAE